MKKLFYIALLVLLCANAMAYDFSAQCSTGQTLYYTITSDTEPYTVEVVSENESSPYYNTTPTGDLEIPETVEYNSITYSVTRIGDHAFKSCNGLTSLEIPNSVTTIGEEAFYQCSGIVGSLTLFNSVTTIGRYSFGSCSGLETITIGSAMDSIAGRAFYNCSSLTTVNFNAVNCRYIGDYSAGLYAFTGCSAAATLNIDENVTYIAGYGFQDWSGLTTVNYNATNSTSSNYIWNDCTSFTSLNIGENVTVIPANLFSGSNITSVIIPNAVTVIGLSAFSSCSALETVTIGYAVDSMAELAFYDCDALTTINYNATNCRECGGTTWTAFSNCDAVRNLNIGENVTNIPAYLFKDLYALNTVTIPSSVTSIGDYAFRYVKNINYSGTATGSPWGAITVNGYEEGDLVYSDDTKTQLTGCSIFATSATIQNTVTSIGDYAFYKCAQLTDISIPNSVTEIGNKIFYGCDGLTEPVYNDTYFVYLPTGYASSEYTIPNGIKHIAGSAFYDCDGLTAITIPNTVTSIGEFAFYSCGGLTNVTINDSITSIGDGAFQSCNNLATVNFNATNCTTMSTNSLYSVFNSCSALTTVNIGENVKIIPDYAFYACRSLTEVTIPDSVTSIGFKAFSLCNALTTVNFNATNCTANGTVFQGSSALSTVNFGENVKNIPEYAFSSCTGLTEITLPDSLVNIDGYAFSGCTGLTSITIPESVTSIGDRAFQNCSGLTTINFNAKNCTTMGNSSVNPVFYNCTSLATVNIGENVTNIPSCAFYDCSSLTSATFGNSVTNIGSYAFSSCSGLTSITIPDSVASIGERAFQNCSGLTTVNFNAQNCTTMGSSSKRVFDNCTLLATLNIGENVKSIPDYAFYGCTGLTEITIPDSVTSIGDRAFSGCNGLTAVYYTGGIEQWCGITFANTTANPLSYAHNLYVNNSLVTDLVIPNNITEIKDNTFYGDSALNSIIIHNSVTSIGSGAFYGCSGLVEVTIPDSITSIGSSAFGNCTNLTIVNFNAKNITSMNSPFQNCSSFSTLNIGESVKSIPNFAFQNCTGLTEVTIPDSITSIGERAFYGCSGLTTVYFNAINCEIMGNSENSAFSNTSLSTLNIGENVKSIPQYAFSKCRGLIIVNFNATNCTTMINGTFFNCSSLVTLNIGENVTNIPANAFYNCSGLTGTLTIPNSVTNIGDNAFNSCSGLSSVTIGNSVENIGNSAFFNCGGLSEVTIGNSITSIGNWAFGDCDALTEVTIPESVTTIGSDAFSGCNELTTVNFNSTYCIFMGEGSGSPFSGSALTTLNIGENVKNIPDRAFQFCETLTNITIPDSVINIGNYSFSNCRNMLSVTIGNSVTSIGETAFSECYGLTSVYYTGTIAQWCGITFANLNSNPLYYASNLYIDNNLVVNLVIPNTITEIKHYAFYGATCLTSVTIPNSVVSIGLYALGRSGLISLTIPESVTEINDNAFNSCSELTTVNFNATNCMTMGNGVWNNCPLLTTLNIDENVTNIPDNAFLGCSGVSRLIVPDMVTNIGSQAFYYCSGLENVKIGKSVEYIGTQAFNECENISSINVSANIPPTISENTFSGTTYSSAILWTPCTLDETYQNNSQWRQFVNIQNDTTSLVLTVQSANADMGSVTGGGTYSCEAQASLTAIPADGYRFLQWSDGSTDNPRTVIVTSDSTFTAGFKATYIITATAGEGGTITPNGETTVDEGGSQSFTITPNECYQIASVMVDGEDVTADLVDGVYSFDNVTTGHTITANFEQITYTITVTAGNGGTITPYGDVEVNCGDNVAITITPNTGYRIASVMVDETENVTDQLVDGVYTFENVAANHTIEATFGAIPEASFTTDPEPIRDTLIIMLEQMVEYTNTSLNAHHIHWYFEGADTVESEQNYVPAVGYIELGIFHTTLVAYNEDETLTDTATLTVVVTTLSSYTITVISANEQYGTVSGSGTYDEGSEVEITAIPNQGYRFVSWNDDNTENPRTITVTSDSTFVATFAEDVPTYTITVVSANEEYGTVTGSGTYAEGDEAIITAIPNEGYMFVSWNGDNTDNPRTITVTSDSTFVAIFDVARPPQYTITVLANNAAYGYVSGGGTYYEGDTIMLTAMPYDGFSFVSWDDGNYDNPRSVVVASDSTFVGDFAKCQITQTIDTVVPNFVTVGDHTFYSTGNYTFAVPYETVCDTIYDIHLRVLAEPVYDIGPNPTKSLLNINSDGFISAVEFYSVTGQLVMRKEVNGYEAVFDLEGFVDGVYVLRIYGEESGLPSIFKVVKE